MSTIDRTVSASTDDCDSQSNSANSDGTGNVIAADLTRTTLQAGSHAVGGTDQWYSGVRFTNITIAQGTTINSATLKLRGAENYTSPSTFEYLVRGQASDDAATFSTAAQNLGTGTRPRTTASKIWDRKVNVLNTLYTLDVTSIVQEIVNRGGWASGNAIVFIIEINNIANEGDWQNHYAYDDTTDQVNNPAKLSITFGETTSIADPRQLSLERPFNMTTVRR